MKPRVGVFHPGTQHSWQTALAFQESSQLAWYATSMFYSPTHWPYKAEKWVSHRLAAKMHREFKKRHSPLLRQENIRLSGWWEWSERIAARTGHPRTAAWCNRRGNSAFGRWITDLARREPVDVLWGYSSSSLEAFRWAKRRDIPCILDQTIGHPKSENEVMLAEKERHPEYFSSSYSPHDLEWIARQDEEVSLADLVVVGSPRCGETMIKNGCPEEKIRVIPYGFDDTAFVSNPSLNTKRGNTPFKFLFVGQVGPRKGIAYLLPAFEALSGPTATLTLIGKSHLPDRIMARLPVGVHHVDQVPRTEISQYFQHADCFVFPSLFEGSALVLYEAVGAGLPIIQSDAAGTGVVQGANGIRLPKVSVSALTSAMSSMLSDNNSRLAMAEASRNMREQFTWLKYRRNVRELLQSV